MNKEIVKCEKYSVGMSFHKMAKCPECKKMNDISINRMSVLEVDAEDYDYIILCTLCGTKFKALNYE